MQSTDINIFVDATVETLEMMCGVETKRCGSLFLRKSLGPETSLMGIIGLSGRLKGTLVLSMEDHVSHKLCREFIGEEDPAQEDVMDCIGEIINMCGSADESCIVCVGVSTDIVIPMEMASIGMLNLEVSIKED